MKNEAAKTENNIVQAKSEKNITDGVMGRIAEMMEKQELFLPGDYSPENALKSAWLKLQEVEDKDHNKALAVCSKESICNALLDMVVQGLTPAKNQCYFIVYGSKLTLSRSYMGTVAVAKRFSDVEEVIANCIYADDELEFEIDPQTGNRRITKHRSCLKNIDIAKIDGVYAVIRRKNAEPYVEIMTMEQVRKAWGQGATKGNSPAHKNFAEEMAKKTVINRACKMFINTSDDSPVLTEVFNRTTEADYPKEDRQYYDSNAGVVIDVEDRDLLDRANDTIFGAATAVPEQRDISEESNVLTEEEKAEIEAMEIAEAMREQAGDSDAAYQ